MKKTSLSRLWKGLRNAVAVSCGLVMVIALLPSKARSQLGLDPCCAMMQVGLNTISGPPVNSMEPLWQDWERTAVENKLGAAIVGSNATVKAGLEKLAGDTGADEVIVVTDTYEHADRIESYRRVAGLATMIEVKPAVAVEA